MLNHHSKNEKKPAPSEPLMLTDGREDRRLTTDMPVIMKVGGVNFRAEFKDISDSGAALTVRTGLLPRKNQDLTLTLIDGTERTAQVVWQHGNIVGLYFGGSKFDVYDVVDPAHLGEEYFKGLIRMRRLAPG